MKIRYYNDESNKQHIAAEISVELEKLLARNEFSKLAKNKNEAEENDNEELSFASAWDFNNITNKVISVRKQIHLIENEGKVSDLSSNFSNNSHLETNHHYYRLIYQ
jgi:hypothetical protein